jgi:UDP-N-acetyl-D-glucosamine dehydrogenase
MSCEGRSRGARVLVVGVTYKPDVADIRESPALEIIDELAAPGAQVAFCDPHIESLHTPHAGRLESHQNSAGDTWNLILVHTRHAGTNHAWLDGRHTVLDITRS